MTHREKKMFLGIVEYAMGIVIFSSFLAEFVDSLYSTASWQSSCLTASQVLQLQA